jgi:hypothetical protein
MIPTTDVLFADPLVPRPEMTAEALRVAVERLDAQQLPAFDADAVRGEPTFLPRWSLWVERHRFPAVARHVHGLEVAMGRAVTDEEARAVAVEMSTLLYAVSDPLPWT